MQGGLHLGPPGFIFIKFPSTQISADINDATCVSKDGLRVKFGVSFQYQLPMEWVKPVVVKYRDMDKWGSIVYAAGMSAVQHSCSKYDISNFQNKRGIIQSEMESKLRIKLEGPDGDGAGGVYARAVSLQLTNVELPEEYREAVSEKQQADEDIELAKNQRTQETTKANTELLAAKEEAKKINHGHKREVIISVPAVDNTGPSGLYKQIKSDKLAQYMATRRTGIPVNTGLHQWGMIHALHDFLTLIMTRCLCLFHRSECTLAFVQPTVEAVADVAVALALFRWGGRRTLTTARVAPTRPRRRR